MNEIISILAQDKDLITYRKELNKITGSVTATILLQQIIYWFTKNDNKSFYKFILPCENSLYQENDSWTEELGFTPSEFKTAYKKLEDKGLVSKKISRERVTYYSLELAAVAKALKLIYLSEDIALPKAISSSTKSNNHTLDYSKSFDRDYTETTKDSAKPKRFDYTPEDMNVAKHLFSKLEALTPGRKEPNFKQWATDVRKMRLLDKRDLKKVEHMINYIFDNNSVFDGWFWRANIASASKLRAQYDQIAQQVNVAIQKAKSA